MSERYLSALTTRDSLDAMQRSSSASHKRSDDIFEVLDMNFFSSRAVPPRKPGFGTNPWSKSILGVRELGDLGGGNLGGSNRCNLQDQGGDCDEDHHSDG